MLPGREFQSDQRDDDDSYFNTILYASKCSVRLNTHVHTACSRLPKVSFLYMCFDRSEVMFVSCTHITLDQSKNRYGQLN